MTASWCQGRAVKYPYYRCRNSTCPAKKNVRREVLHSDLEVILKKAAPRKGITDLFFQVLAEVYAVRKDQILSSCHSHRSRISDLTAKTDVLMEKLASTTNPEMTRMYEGKVEKLQGQIQELRRELAHLEDTDFNVETIKALAAPALKNPLAEWHKGDIDGRRRLIKMVFAKPLRYIPGKGFETTDLSLP